ncbi:TPA: hypothetical protein G8O11_001306 [Salmonella enterica]|nr:hypothetical protein [Salmonella enterica]
MGIYRWYLLFSLMVFSAFSYSAVSDKINTIPDSLFKSRSSIDSNLTNEQCQERPLLKSYQMSQWVQKGLDFYALYNGCIYLATGSASVCVPGDFCLSDWVPVKAYVKPDSGDDDSGGDTGNTGGDTDGDSTPPTEPDNPGVIPPVKPPVKPPVNPDSSSVSQLYEQYHNCSVQLSSFPKPNFDNYNPSVDYEYNAQVRQCNSVYDRLTSMIKSGAINGGTDDNHDFITGDGYGQFYKCKRNPYTPQEWADQGKLYPGPVLGTQLLKNSEREIGFNCRIVDGKNQCDWHLNFPYVKDDGNGTSVCNSVYSSSLGSGDSDSGSQGDGSGDGSGQGDSGNSGGSDSDTGSGDDSGPGLSTPSLDVPDLTLAPLWNIWPSARDFKLTLPAAQCPVFNIEVFGTNHKIDTFCTIFTPAIIAIIRSISILTASIISFVIVLRS